jgi:hypothetical protein
VRAYASVATCPKCAAKQPHLGLAGRGGVCVAWFCKVVFTLKEKKKKKPLIVISHKK